MPVDDETIPGGRRTPGTRAPIRTRPAPTLFDEVSARLPLFDTLDEDSLERLAAAGYGRGLLTASLRARLRKAGFADMGALAGAAPTDLLAVRKIGPLRVAALRIHLLGELARMVPGSRADHDDEATARRRLDRLRAVPVPSLPLDPPLLARLGRSVATAADLARLRRTEIGTDLTTCPTDPERIVVALTRVLQPVPCRSVSDDPAADAVTEPETEHRRDRAAVLRERDREWDAAAPATGNEGDGKT